MTSPCEACGLKLDPKMFEGKSLLEGLAVGANFGTEILERHHALLAEKDRTIAELRDLVSEEITRSRSKTWLRRAESILARKKEKSPSESTPGAGKGDRT